MRISLKKLRKIIGDEIRDVLSSDRNSIEQTNVENLNVIDILAEKSKIKLEGDAKFDKNGSLVLTTDLHQNGRATYKNKIDLTSRPWKLSSTFYMTNNKGIKDVDIVGGDGIWYEFNGKQLSIAFDTFMNEYNKTGNEINIFSETQVVADKFYPICFNNGKEYNIEIICKPIGSPSLSVVINSKPFMEYNLKTVDMFYLFQKPAEISVSSFTGDAGSKQV